MRDTCSAFSRAAAWGSLLITKAFCMPHSCAVEGKAAQGTLGAFAEQF